MSDDVDSSRHFTEHSETYEMGDINGVSGTEKPGSSHITIDDVANISESVGGKGGVDTAQIDAMIQQFVPANKRPHHRLGFMGLWGKKVDTIEWCKVHTYLFSQ